MKVTIFGTGYVGLVQAAVLANVGHEICCVDVDKQKIEGLKKGIIPIYEPRLKELVTKNIQSGLLQFTTDAKNGVDFGEILFIAVATPPEEDGSADMQYVLQVATTIAEHMESIKTIVNKSTVPVGTADRVEETIKRVLNERKVELKFDVVSNPEFLKEGSAVKDCQRPERIIIGTDSEVSEKNMRELYQPFNRNHDKFIMMDRRSAEMTKYAANCMLATKVSFMNEMANIAERVGADIEQIRKGIGSDSRIGFQFIYPGCGYGGSCFPKDIKALIHSASITGYDAQILNAVEEVNSKQKKKLFEYITQHFDGNLKDKKFALWGLAFKPDTDDIREASSLVLMRQLWDAGAHVYAYDPEAMDAVNKIYGDESRLTLVDSKEAALEEANALIICTEWKNFRAPDFTFIKNVLIDKVVFDGRNLFDPLQVKEYGLTYYSIGRPAYV